MILNVIQWNNVAVATLIFLSIVLLLTLVLLLAKHYLVNSGERWPSRSTTVRNFSTLRPASPSSPLSARTASICRRHAEAREAADNAKVQVLSGGGEILPTEAVHFSRKEVKDHWRLGCQVKVKNDLDIKVAESALDVKGNGNAR